MRIEQEVKLDFCDVLIKPKRSKAPSRHAVDLQKDCEFLNSKKTWKGCPIISANMNTTGTFAMARVMASQNMLVALHKYYSVEELERFYLLEPEAAAHAFYTLGIKDEDFAKVKAFTERYNGGPKLLNLDVANGYTEFFVNKCKQLREMFPEAIIMAGNVCTSEMVQELLLDGKVDIVKLGIGPGSVCTTRVMTGVGYPQLSTILECADIAHGLNGHVCADGGCTVAGDIAKAFGAGTDFVMLGGMLSGTDECEGEWEYGPEILKTEQTMKVVRDMGSYEKYKQIKKKLKFYGMSSKEAMEKYAGGMASYRAAEGKCVEVAYKGPALNVLNEIQGGLRSACTYVGTEKLKDLSKCTTFVKVNRTHNTVYGG